MVFNPEVIPQDRPPIFIGAGFNKHQIPALDIAFEDTIAAQTLGSFTDTEWAGNSQGGRLNVVHWDAENQAFYNSIGLENPGRAAASEYLQETLRAIKNAGQLAIVSVTTLKHEDPAEVLPGLVEWALEMGADVAEINGSCRNQSPDHPLLCMDVDETLEVMGEVRARVGDDPAIAYKVSPLELEIIEGYKAEPNSGIDIIVTTNTKGNQPVPINPETGKPYIEVNDGLAGMSGPAIRDLSVDNLLKWVGGPYTIFSLGGVSDGFEVAFRQREGAALVGGVQEFYRSSKPRRVAQRWAQEYIDVA